MALKLKDNQYTKNEKEQALGLLQTHFSVSTTEITTNNAENQNPDKDTWLLAQKIINYSSVELAINSFKKFKSPGIDGIWSAQLQNGEQIISAL
ncbi:unnamed protein product, partial [Ceratitis capitata]